VENDLKSARIRSTCYGEVILIKKPSKMYFLQAAQIATAFSGEIAGESDPNTIARQGLIPNFGIALCTALQSRPSLGVAAGRR
jgi:hypothetical protein